MVLLDDVVSPHPMRWSHRRLRGHPSSSGRLLDPALLHSGSPYFSQASVSFEPSEIAILHHIDGTSDSARHQLPRSVSRVEVAKAQLPRKSVQAHAALQLPGLTEDVAAGPDEDEELLSARGDSGGIPDFDAEAERGGAKWGGEEEPEDAELTKPQVRRIVLEELYKRAGPPVKRGETIGVFGAAFVRDPANNRWVAADKPKRVRPRPAGFTAEFNQPRPELREHLDQLQGAEEFRRFLRNKGMNPPAFLAGRVQPTGVRVVEHNV
jgi:hypothetical protein